MTYRKLTMDELWLLLSEDIPSSMAKVFSKPTFPTRRWGKITLSDCTTDILSITKGIDKLNKRGIKCRKRIDGITSSRFRGYKFYYIEIDSSVEL